MASFRNSYRHPEHFIPQTNDSDWGVYFPTYPWAPTEHICMSTADSSFANSQYVPSTQLSCEETRTYSTTSSPLISHGVSPRYESSSAWPCDTDKMIHLYGPFREHQQIPSHLPFLNEVRDFIGDSYISDSYAQKTHSISKDLDQTSKSEYVFEIFPFPNWFCVSDCDSVWGAPWFIVAGGTVPIPEDSLVRHAYGDTSNQPISLQKRWSARTATRRLDLGGKISFERTNG